MSYARPPFDAADATWEGAQEYTRPPYDAADATWQIQLITATIVLAGPRGRVAATAEVGAPATITATVQLSGPRGRIAARGSVPALAALRLAGPRTTLSAAITVRRYELVGEVRDQGVLVNRLVRAYRRDTGAPAAEGETSAGRFRLRVGFEPREHYILPVHLDDDATDYAPPCANRVLSELAMDEAPA